MDFRYFLLLRTLDEIVFATVGLDASWCDGKVDSGDILDGADDPRGQLIASILGEHQVIS
jgi:hypothetical protein